jgi:hypothetical protein
MRENAQNGPQLASQHHFSRYKAIHKEAKRKPRIHNYTACYRCMKAFPHSHMGDFEAQSNHPIDSKIVHNQFIRQEETNQPCSVILSASAQDLGVQREILR